MLKLLLTSQVFSVSVDCPDIINLAYGVGMPSVQPGIWTALKADCCLASGVTCVSQRVTSISWDNIGPNGIINGTAIPSTVIYVNLSNNELTGTIPDLWPSGLIALYLSNNHFIGDVPTFPLSLQILVLGYPGYPGNHFSGVVRINAPTQLYINDNWITDIIIQDRSGLTNNCDLSNNPLLGNPNIDFLNTCTKNGLYSVNLLPKTATTFKRYNVVTSTPSIVRYTSSTISRASAFFRITSVIQTVNIIDHMGTTEIPPSTQAPLFSVHTYSEFADRTTQEYGISIFSTIGHMVFAPRSLPFAFDFKMVIQLLIELMILIYVLKTTPFSRELKRKMTKKNHKEFKISVEL